jgi:hypothetical protein
MNEYDLASRIAFVLEDWQKGKNPDVTYKVIERPSNMNRMGTRILVQDLYHGGTFRVEVEQI